MSESESISRMYKLKDGAEKAGYNVSDEENQAFDVSIRALEKIIRISDMVDGGVTSLSHEEAIDLLLDIVVEISV